MRVLILNRFNSVSHGSINPQVPELPYIIQTLCQIHLCPSFGKLYCLIFFFSGSSRGVAYANFIFDLLSVVFSEHTELIRLFEMECLI